MKEVKPPADEAGGPVWLSQVMDTHETLAKNISRFIIVSVALSAALACLMALVTSAHGGKRLILVGALVGLWLGAFVAGTFRALFRSLSGNGFEYGGAAYVPGWFVSKLGLTSPFVLVTDIIRWRQLTALLAAQRQYPSVRDYLDKGKAHVTRNLLAVLVFYFGASAVILILLHS